jgi:CO/xanthine dehydrogenase Mo-binding subunit
MEHMALNEGRVETQGLHEYLIPTALDLPENIEIELLESGSGRGPDGAKGIGEAGAVAAPSALANAIYDALGKQILSITTTPEEISEL